MKLSNFITVQDATGQPYLKESGSYQIDGRRAFSHPEDFNEFFGDVIGIRHCADEYVYIACMDSKNKLIGCFQASHGSVDASMFPVREIFQKALLIGAAKIAMSHNHPSGDCTPSQADIQATKRLKEAANLLNIDLLDHIIVSRNGYFSFMESGILQ